MRGNRRQPPGEPCNIPIKVKDQCLIQDARNGDLHQMKKRMRSSIFKKVEDVNQRDERNCTPLHYAAKNSHLDMIRYLISKSADIGALDKHGWSVLQYAVRYASVPTVELLIEFEADIHHRENKGWNCLHLASRNGHAEKARVLLECGINVEETQNQGWNALHLAVRYGQPDTISLLLEYGININADNLGWSALHLAALNGHTDIASILLNKGSSTTLVNQDGCSALQIAREENHDRIVAIILEREFQGQQCPELPSPPPSPPSAPPLEVFQNNNDESFADWRNKIKRQLENINEDTVEDSDYSSGAGSSEDGVNNNRETSKGDTIRIQWKTLEEEEGELMRQLENVRLREVNQIKKMIVKRKTEMTARKNKFDKQKLLLTTKIEQLQYSLPEIEERYSDLIKDHEIEYKQLSNLTEKIWNEGREIRSLVEKRSKYTNPLNYQHRKDEILKELLNVHETELESLEGSKRELMSRKENDRSKLENERKLVKDKIKLLEAEIEHNQKSKLNLIRDDENSLEELKEELERAERRSVLNARNCDQDGEHDWFGCPVCMSLLKPPLRIFQCPEGHILCEECKDNPPLVHCPQCRFPLEGNCSRNRALEEVARSYFPMAPSETL